MSKDAPERDRDEDGEERTGVLQKRDAEKLVFLCKRNMLSKNSIASLEVLSEKQPP